MTRYVDIRKVVQEAFQIGMGQDEWEITRFCELLAFDYVLAFHNHPVLEIGSDKGGTFHLWQRIIVPPVAISVDLPFGPWGSRCDMTDRNEAWRGKYGTMSKSVLGDSHDASTLDAVVHHLRGFQHVGMLFIDGDHSYGGVKKDFEMYSPLVASGGWVVFHDINETEFHKNQGCYVHGFWSTLKGKKITISSGHDSGGIGIWFKP